MSKRANILLRGLGGGSGVKAFTLAQDRADLALKKAIRSGDKSKGLELAIKFLEPWTTSGTEKEQLDALTKIEVWSNELETIKSKSRQEKLGVSEFKARLEDLSMVDTDLPEDESGAAVTFRSPADILEGVAPSLEVLAYDIEQEVAAREREGSLTDDYRESVLEIAKQARELLDFKVSADNGELPAGQATRKFVYKLTTDPDTGELIGAGIVPVSSLGSDYAKLGANVSYGDVKMPVAVNFSSIGPTGKQEIKIGPYVATRLSAQQPFQNAVAPDGSTMNLRLGDLVLPDQFTAPKKERLTRPGDMVVGISGYNEDGTPIKKAVMTGHDGKRYLVDPTNQLIGTTKAPIPVSSGDFAKFSRDAMPYEPTLREEGRTPIMPEVGASTVLPPTAEDGRSSATAFFADRKNRAVGTETQDAARGAGKSIIEAGKSFFRNVLTK